MNPKWLKEAIVYQIYPRSFKDSNDDGIGDLKGIQSKLDYLVNLGVNMIWLSPIYQSPNDDNGYDISDYQAILNDFGTMDDWKNLLLEMHKKGLRLMMDLVINHTSDEHPWFQQSRQNKDNPYREFYIWRDGKKGKEPNNWTSFFTGNAWNFDPNTSQYYLHLFSPKQPDLNWDYPPLREEIKKMIRFWLDLGVDGFRCDVINLISKKEGLPNGKNRIALTGFEHYANGPHVHEYLQELHRDVFSNYDMLSVGEAPYLDPLEAIKYVQEDRNELSMMFHFQHMNVDSINNKWIIVPWKVKKLKKILNHWQEVMQSKKGWNSLYFENHDQPRSLSRFGDPLLYPIESATLLATLLLTQQGTPYIFQGQEIGMTNYPFTRTDEFVDVESKRIYDLGRKVFHLPESFMLRTLQYMSRDNARTPMQWNSQPHAGFSHTTPWMVVHPNYVNVNVEVELKDSHSILNFYKKLIQLRKTQSALLDGTYKIYYKNHPSLYVYVRDSGIQKLLIVMNFSKKMTSFTWPKDLPLGRLVLGNYFHLSLNKKMTLLPYESMVIELHQKG